MDLQCLLMLLTIHLIANYHAVQMVDPEPGSAPTSFSSPPSFTRGPYDRRFAPPLLRVLLRGDPLFLPLQLPGERDSQSGYRTLPPEKRLCKGLSHQQRQSIIRQEQQQAGYPPHPNHPVYILGSSLIRWYLLG